MKEPTPPSRVFRGVLVCLGIWWLLSFLPTPYEFVESSGTDTVFSSYVDSRQVPVPYPLPHRSSIYP